MYENILTELKDGIFTITINRSDKLNALNQGVMADLKSALDEVYSNPEVKGVLLTGSGEKAFVAGADISEFLSMNDAKATEISGNNSNHVFHRFANCPKPVVAAVNGFALGGGCELAMACHFRTASTKAKFGQPEVNLGLIPGYGGTQRLVHLIGLGRAMELLMTADMIDANTALNYGLVNHVYEPEQLIEESRKILSKIISKAPLAIEKIIKLANIAVTGDIAGFKKEVSEFGASFATEDKVEGTTAFIEKRPAVFKGK